MRRTGCFRIYTAASYRHVHAVKLFHELLRSRISDIEILDWTSLTTPPEGMTPAERRAWMDSDTSGNIFEFCRKSCTSADVVIYFGESGQDAGIEIGMAAQAGIPVIGLRGPLEAPGLMLYGAVSEWYTEALEVVARLEEMAAEAAHGNVSPAFLEKHQEYREAV